MTGEADLLGDGEPPGLRDDFHAPYHAALKGLLEEHLGDRQAVVLVDAHSVASVANRLHGELRSEIYLGDRDGRSGSAWLRDCLRTAFEVEGYAVSINDPYKGGFITDHYGQMDGVDAIQIEMCQRVYMDENMPGSGTSHPRFGIAKLALRRVFTSLASRIA